MGWGAVVAAGWVGAEVAASVAVGALVWVGGKVATGVAVDAPGSVGIKVSICVGCRIAGFRVAVAVGGKFIADVGVGSPAPGPGPQAEAIMATSAKSGIR